MSPPGLLIFDCDGVLVDSELLSCRADAACLAEAGIPLSVEAVLARYVGVNLAGMLADLEQRFGPLPPDLAETMRRRTRAAFDAELTAVAGVEALLDAVSLPRCVASGSEPARIRQSLALTGLLHRFEPHIFSAAQVPRGKPAPDLFLFAANRMDTAPGHCLVIEDSVPGVQAASSAGMQVYGFTGGSHCRPGHGDRLRAAGANRVFADMRQLPGLLGA